MLLRPHAPSYTPYSISEHHSFLFTARHLLTFDRARRRLRAGTIRLLATRAAVGRGGATPASRAAAVSEGAAKTSVLIRAAASSVRGHFASRRRGRSLC